VLAVLPNHPHPHQETLAGEETVQLAAVMVCKFQIDPILLAQEYLSCFDVQVTQYLAERLVQDLLTSVEECQG